MHFIFSYIASTLLFIFSFLPVVYAGSLANAKVTISDSRAGQTGVTHTFSFVTGTAGTIKTVEMLYCTTPSGSCTNPNGIDTTNASQGSITGLTSGTTNTATNGMFIFTVSSPSSVNAGTALTLPYLTITNPSTIDSSFFVRITTKDASDVTIDSTSVAFATLDTNSLAMSANVGATFSVALAAVTTGSVNGQTINVAASTASTIPFGSLTSGSTKVAAHDITVITNSSSGYAVTVRANNPPLVDGSNNIDNFIEPNSLPLLWSSPAGSTPNVNTGFLGYTTEDTSLCTGTANRFSGNKWAGFDTTPYEIVCNPSPVLSGETTRLGWQIEVNGMQPSGNYAGVLTIVTTPTY